MKKGKWIVAMVLVLTTAITVLSAIAFIRTHGRTVIEFDIHQNMDAISESAFGEPPQFAIWIENPETHSTHTVFATYRSAKGDWIGKTECPTALPLWFEVFKKERNRPNLPNPRDPAPDAITGATPKADHFKIMVEVKPGTKWICWVEVNLAGDFNAKYQQYGQLSGPADIHFSGQPPLVYRAEIEAKVSQEAEAKLYGQSVIGSDKVEPVSQDVTTAKDIFKSIKIRVVTPKPYLVSKPIRY
jgi:hypothetical protein